MSEPPPLTTLAVGTVGDLAPLCARAAATAGGGAGGEGGRRACSSLHRRVAGRRAMAAGAPWWGVLGLRVQVQDGEAQGVQGCQRGFPQSPVKSHCAFPSGSAARRCLAKSSGEQGRATRLCAQEGPLLGQCRCRSPRCLHLFCRGGGQPFICRLSAAASAGCLQRPIRLAAFGGTSPTGSLSFWIAHVAALFPADTSPSYSAPLLTFLRFSLHLPFSLHHLPVIPFPLRLPFLLFPLLHALGCMGSHQEWASARTLYGLRRRALG